MLTTRQKSLIQNLNSVKTSVKTKSQYNAYQQMLTRIRRFGFGAIEDLSFLTKELPDEEITKIFTRDPMDTLFDSIRKLASLSEVKKQLALSEFIKDLNKNIMSPEDIEAHERLKSEFFHSPEILQDQMDDLKHELDTRKGVIEGLRRFIKEQELKEKYISDYIQGVKADQVERFKRLGRTDEEISDTFDEAWENKMRESIWPDD